jgi:hypothetical protein
MHNTMQWLYNVVHAHTIPDCWEPTKSHPGSNQLFNDAGACTSTHCNMYPWPSDAHIICNDHLLLYLGLELQGIYNLYYEVLVTVHSSRGNAHSSRGKTVSTQPILLCTSTANNCCAQQ